MKIKSNMNRLPTSPAIKTPPVAVASSTESKVEEPVQQPQQHEQKETYDTLINKLTARKEEWIKEFGGKTNYNPYLEAARWMDNFIKILRLGQMPLPMAIQEFEKIPVECPPINPNYVAPTPEPPSHFHPSAKQFGAKNVGE